MRKEPPKTWLELFGYRPDGHHDTTYQWAASPEPVLADDSGMDLDMWFYTRAREYMEYFGIRARGQA